MSAEKLSSCPGAPVSQCSVSGYRCFCDNRQWHCQITSQGSGICACGQLDGSTYGGMVDGSTSD
jgi:hypothetical protein